MWLPILKEIIIASISGNHNFQYFWEFIDANISEIHIFRISVANISGSYNYVIIANISEIIFSGFREVIIDNMIEHIDTIRWHF